MKKVLLLLTILFAVPQLVAAQRNQTTEKEKSKLTGKAAVNGRLIDGSTTECMPQVTVQLFELPDTTFIYGTVSDNEGWFNIKKVPVGEFLLRYSDQKRYSAYGSKEDTQCAGDLRDHVRK